MEVAPGYKQTEVGVIPEDWNLVALGAISETSSGTTPARALGDRYYRNGTVAWVKTLDLNNSEIRSTEERVTSLALKETSLRCYPPGSVLVAMYGGFNQIGRTGILCIPATVNQALTAIRPDTNRLHAGYLLRVLNFRVSHWKSVASSSRKDPNITSQDVRAFPVPLPSVAEQEAIAEALSDADALIESLERLLAKKRDLKRGAMQELLTGKKRLPGFSEKWEVKRLGSVLRFQVGFPFSSVFFNEEGQGIRIVKNRDLKSDDQVFCHSGSFAQEFLIRDGDVLVGMDGDFVPCLWTKGPALLNQRVGRIVPLSGIDRVFAFYYLAEPLKEIENATSSTTVKHLSHGDIEGIEKALPPVEEQSAIASILADMDAEIAALEERLGKARQLKIGMMQELLTGRKRLI